MTRSTHPITRLVALATTILGLVLVTAGQAAAMQQPGPGGPVGDDQSSSTVPLQQIADSSISLLQWFVFAAAVVAALAVGAALMHLADRRHAELGAH